MNKNDPSVIHLFDCADVGRTLVKHGVANGLHWKYQPAREGDAKHFLRHKAAAAAWHGERIVKTSASQLVHLHYGWRAHALEWFPRRPHIVHIHGSDISIHFASDPQARKVIQHGMDTALAVVFSTPDLAEATIGARSDSEYLPNPVETDGLPYWQPALQPTIVFSSRWERRKGSEANLEIAAALVRATRGRARVQALDWGDEDSRARARQVGVELVPKMGRDDYLKWLAQAHVTIGHQGGIFAISEFQAVAIGVPTVMKLGEGFYPGPHPVLGGDTVDDLVQQALLALDDPLAVSARLRGREWVERHHSPGEAVRRLAAVYRRVT